CKEDAGPSILFLVFVVIDGKLGPVTQFKLCQHLRDVIPHSPLTKIQFLCNLPVAQTLGDFPQYPLLPFGKNCHCPAMRPGGHTFYNIAVKDHIAGCDSLDGGQYPFEIIFEQIPLATDFKCLVYVLIILEGGDQQDVRPAVFIQYLPARFKSGHAVHPYIRHQEIRRVFPVKGNRLPPASARGHNSVSGTFQYRPEGINNQCIVIYYYYIHLFDALLVKRNMDRKSTVMECVEY